MTEHFKHCYIHEGQLCSCGAGGPVDGPASCPSPEPCDVDCEAGPVHCPNAHLPRHKWHAHTPIPPEGGAQ